ncbi:hypothetical protein [Microbacterium sp. Yaish 1]|uniref:hypothetical protein n=1 Tax=Microbacterium sp. Yaish 1 TaxID=2025014 RepID=UPI00117C5FA2|nr:hypothetical protein [Microbacterium sp. Yaish 1]
MQKQRGAMSAVIIAAACAVLAGCSQEVTVENVDGVLWRQVAAFEDPFMSAVHDRSDLTLDAYVHRLASSAQQWDGTDAGAAQLGLEDGGIAMYDVSISAEKVTLSMFVSSGPRRGGDSYGPDELYTCARFTVNADPGPSGGGVNRDAFEECPDALIAVLGDGAAFARVSVFDG